MSSDLSDAVREHLARKLAAELDDKALMAFSATTSSAAAPGPTLNVEAALAEWNRLLAEHRRTNVRVRVSLFAPNPPLMHQTEKDGRIVECDHRTAMSIHREVPLVLERVEGPLSALFRVATPFDRFVPTVLDAPPYVSPAPPAKEEQEEP